MALTPLEISEIDHLIRNLSRGLKHQLVEIFDEQNDPPDLTIETYSKLESKDTWIVTLLGSKEAIKNKIR